MKRNPECERLLDFEQLTDGRFVVTNPCGLDFGWFRVPYGYVSDGDTMPDWVRSWWDTDSLRLIRLLYAIGHDYLYWTKKVPRWVADRWMRESVISDGFPPWRAWTEWSLVRLCGWWFWYESLGTGFVSRD